MDDIGQNTESNGRDSAGKFAPGHNGFKKKGLPEYQRQTRDLLWDFFQQKAKTLPELYDELNPATKAKLIMTVAEFFLPKQREILIDATLDGTLNDGIDMSNWSEEDLRTLIQLQQKYHTLEN
jgi:hypothetical protein